MMSHIETDVFNIETGEELAITLNTLTIDSTMKIDGIPYDFKFLYGVLGYNFKCSEMNAAFGLVQLDRFEDFKAARRRNIERYLDNLKDLREVLLPDDSIQPNWLAVPLQTDDRLGLLTFLEQNNIQTRVTFAGNVTRHPAYRHYLQAFDNADTIMKNGFFVGCSSRNGSRGRGLRL